MFICSHGETSSHALIPEITGTQGTMGDDVVKDHSFSGRHARVHSSVCADQIDPALCMLNRETS